MVSIELVQLFSYPTKSDTSNTNYLYGLFLASLTIIFLTLQRLLIILKNQEEYSRKLEDKVQERTQSLNETLRKIQSELNTARKFQQKMLPDLYELQNLPLKTAARFLPMNVVGGDIYFITPLPNGKIRYFLADAAGHSIAAAIVTIAIKGEFEANSPSCPNPQQVLEILNSKFVAKYRSLNTFFSAVICDIDPKQNKLTFASAGHPTQFLNHQSQLILLKHTGPLIGIMDKVVYQQEEFPFIRGDNLLLFTDGILEQTKIENGKRYEFGEHRLAEIFAALSGSDAVDMADIIETELLRYAEGSPQEDDITFITVSY